MHRPPAVIFVVRHGLRLDAADKDWHLGSPTPYDPPLTYGGWTQSRALGARIASLLHTLEHEDGTRRDQRNGHVHFADELLKPSGNGENEARPSKRQKHKIVIHSSPFLRCVQTSVAISAGIAQFQPSNDFSADDTLSPRLPSTHYFRSRSPGLRPLDTHLAGFGPKLHGENGLASPRSNNASTERRTKPTLCVDAFLGEWQNPEYYDMITPPPNSTMMVAGAKADLLRRGDAVESVEGSPTSKGFFPGGWSAGGSSAVTGSPTLRPMTQAGPLSSMSILGQALSKRERSSSQGNPLGSPTMSSDRGAPSFTSHKMEDIAHYAPPVPSYAISSSERIPRGYVTHARDACVNVAYQWDSMREPQNWGDGGEYGEEWSSMHKRFRNGLASMISWYSMDSPRRLVEDGDESREKDADDVDDDEELVLVLVTHGAGCNALLGALTEQPILINVEMSSLSMATRKDNSVSEPNSPLPNGSNRRTFASSGLSQVYEMQIVASTEHLRQDADRSRTSHLPSPKIVPQIPEYRRRLGAHSAAGSPIDMQQGLGEPARPLNSSLGSMRRSLSTNTVEGKSIPPAKIQDSSPVISQGLWSKTNPAKVDSAIESPGLDGKFVLEPTYTDATAGALSKPTLHVSEVEGDDVPPLPAPLVRQSSQHGLWGSSLAPANAQPSKRRWTMNEREA